MKKIKAKRIKAQEKKLPNVDLQDVLNNNSSHLEQPSVNTAEKVKRKRRFKRKYLQPQPKKSRKRKSRNSILENILPEGWNGIVKNISDQPVSEVEKKLLEKGKKFTPVELDPPILRMQRELNDFYRTLRIEWCFYGQKDGRSDLEKKFLSQIRLETPQGLP